MKEATSILSVVCAIIVKPDDNHQCLVTKRSLNDKYLPGKWEFPGGKVEDGESNTRALIREIEEELQIIIKVSEPLTPVVHQYPHLNIRLIPFICNWESGMLEPTEHDEVLWVKKSDIHSLDWAPADIPIAEEWVQHSTVPKN